MQTVFRMGRFVVAMFGNSIARGFPVADELILTYICGTIVLILAGIGLAVAWRRGLFLNKALPWACLLFFAFLTAAFVCVGRVWRGDYQPLTPRYATFGAFCIVAMVALLSSAFSGVSEASAKSESIRRDIMLRTQGLLVGVYLCILGVNWIYGQDLMEEWRINPLACSGEAAFSWEDSVLRGTQSARRQGGIHRSYGRKFGKVGHAEAAASHRYAHFSSG